MTSSEPSSPRWDQPLPLPEPLLVEKRAPRSKVGAGQIVAIVIGCAVLAAVLVLGIVIAASA